jgi:peroxiredoxin
LTELGDEGVQILAISPDPNEKSQELAQKLRARYRFLTDSDLAVTRRYGLLHVRGGHKGQDVARPTTVVIDRRGIVRWLQLADSIQIRPDSTDVARAVRQLGS